MNPLPPEPAETVDEAPSPPASLKRSPWWQLAVPLLLQMGILGAVAVPSLQIQQTGRTVTFKTNLAYTYNYGGSINSSTSLLYPALESTGLRKLPGWQELLPQRKVEPGVKPIAPRDQMLPHKTVFYLVVEAPAQSSTGQPWKPIRVAAQLPTALPENQVALKGRARWSEMTYGLRSYTLSAEQINSLNARQSQLKGWIEAKVDAQGNAVLVKLHLDPTPKIPPQQTPPASKIAPSKPLKPSPGPSPRTP